MTKYLVEIEHEHYRGEDGSHIRRESQVRTEYGTYRDRWVLRDRSMAYVDSDQFRHDLMERHGFSTTIKSLSEFLLEKLG